MYWIANPDIAGRYREETPFLKQDRLMVLINGWFFDFENMVATRDPNWSHYDPQAMNTRTININFNRVYRYIAGNCFLGFFTEPEEHFDQKIVEAYLDFVAEKTLLK